VWDGITVMVMPLRKNFLQIVDSNVGVVHHCEQLGQLVTRNKYEHMDNAKLTESGALCCGVCGAIPGSVIVKAGQKPECEFRALAGIVGSEAALEILEDDKSAKKPS